MKLIWGHPIKLTMILPAVLVSTLFLTTQPALAAVTITEYPNTMTAGSAPHHLVLGPDGNMWFTEFETSGKIGVMSPSGSMITEHTLAANAHPNDITVGPDGNLWFTEYASPGGAAAIGRITTSGMLNEFTLSPSTARPHAIAAAPDGNLWFTQLGTQAIGRIQTDGTIVTPAISLATTCSGTCQPYGIVVGPDGNIWFTEWTDNKIVKMDISGNTLATYPIAGHSEPYEIISGPDGKLWFTLEKEGVGLGATSGRAVASITTGGTINYYLTPTAGSVPHGIIAGPDGNIWFSENSPSGGNKIGMLVPSTGQITECSTPTAPSTPFGLALGPNNTIWFAESSANILGVISGLSLPSASPGGGTGAPQAPKTGYGASGESMLNSFAIFGLGAALLFGLALATRRLATANLD